MDRKEREKLKPAAEISKDIIREASKIANSVVRATAMTESLDKDERDEMWQIEYKAALDRLLKK